MITLEYVTKCDAHRCNNEHRHEIRYYEGMQLPSENYFVPDGWNRIRLNNGSGLVYCPVHLVSVEIKPRVLKGLKGGEIEGGERKREGFAGSQDSTDFRRN